MLTLLFMAAMRSPAEKGLTFWLLLVMFIVFLLLSRQVWYLIILFPDLCRLAYFQIHFNIIETQVSKTETRL